MRLRAADASDALALAKAHASGFDSPWPPEAFAALMDTPGVFALAAIDGTPVGLILMRAIAGEAEVLTLAVEPSHRRRGVARALLRGGLAQAAAMGAEEAFLEVAADNSAALALYHDEGFEQAGQRGGYYRRPAGRTVDALVLRRTLNGGPNP
ncbi:MAG TPA: GNAT family N-acetyltransferase [Caulobacteraceae bacterium]|jgi:ribosomal-protein-alanine N-acetyltransferase